ncbi:acyl-CoA thioesterase [Pseudoxanthomonas sp. SGD-10]|nr:acyl-CoA thioesterase [Pseudoxanthomonas sp. SGD-10]
MTREEKIQAARTNVFKTVFPDITNHHNTMFGGNVMAMMDEIAFITATRYARKAFVTVGSEKISFIKPIPAGSFVELIGNIIHIGNTSIKVAVEVFVEDMYSDERYKASHGEFTLVAIDNNKKPVRIE